MAEGSGSADEGPLGDPDHDGYLNYEELELGTDPNLSGGLPGALLMETWTGVDGNKVEDLTWGTKYAGPPNSSAFVYSSETPQNRTDRFGSRLRGYIIPPATGDYRFHVSGNNCCQLWLSTFDSQFQKNRIAYVNGWTVPGEWHKYSSQQSALVPLQAGVKYYLEAVMKDGVGDDCSTQACIRHPWQTIKEWIPDEEPDLDWFNRPRNPSNPDPDGLDQRPTWKPEEIHLDDERILVLESTWPRPTGS